MKIALVVDLTPTPAKIRVPEDSTDLTFRLKATSGLAVVDIVYELPQKWNILFASGKCLSHPVSAKLGSDDGPSRRLTLNDVQVYGTDDIQVRVQFVKAGAGTTPLKFEVKAKAASGQDACDTICLVGVK